MMMIFWMACFFYVALLAEGARILAIIPIPSYSHQIHFQPLWIALSRRGHEIVVLTTDPIDDPNLTNLTEINFRTGYKIIENIDFVKKKLHAGSWLTTAYSGMWDLAIEVSEAVYKHPEIRKMYSPNSDKKFDIVFAEMMLTPAIYALAHRFKAPIIGLMSFGLYSNHYYLLGAPVLTSHPSTWELENDTGFNLPLWQRTKNFVRLWHYIYLVLNDFMPKQQAVAEKYLGKDIPDISDMERNISIIFCNQQETISFVRPKTSNIILYERSQFSRKPALSRDLKEFVDDAPNGFIYVSLGTNIKMSSFPKYVNDLFRDVLASLPCKVVWRTDRELTNKPDNIYIARWFPQQSILAHPNIRLFVYQGGLQSTEEAVYYTVPLLGLPVLADQDSQVNKMVSLGVAKRLTIFDISREEMNASILEILTDKRYKEKMIKVKILNEDKPYNSLENAIWWTEFVIRHKGASHLHTSIAYDPWYQKYDMDIIAMLSVIIFATLFCTLVITYKFLKIIFKHYIKTPNDLKKKIN